MFQSVLSEKHERIAAATKIQGMFRSMKARQEVRKMLKKIVVQRYDSASRQYYYQNTKTGVASWTQPKLLRHPEQPQQSSQQVVWTAAQDPNSGATYWYNNLGETTWENPYAG